VIIAKPKETGLINFDKESEQCKNADGQESKSFTNPIGGTDGIKETTQES